MELLFKDEAIRYSTRPYLSCVSTFETQFGIGKTRAVRINAFLLNHPLQVIFARPLHYVLKKGVIRGIPDAIDVLKRLRVQIVEALKKKIGIYTYRMFRMFQGLPMSGGSSRSTGKRNQVNAYLCHKLSIPYYDEYAINYYQKQLFYNDKIDDLNKYKSDLDDQEKNKKKDRKERTKMTQQAYRRNNAKKRT
jgi:ribosomal protein S13